MSQYPSQFPTSPANLDYQSRVGTSTLSQFFNAVYAWMAAGLALTALVAWLVSNNMNLVHQVFSPGMLIVLFVVEIGLVVVISSAIRRISAGVATALFMLYAAINGITLSILFLVYAQESLAGTFFVTAGTFAAVSVYGYVTKTDLSRMGSFLFMALIGLIIATVVNIFVASSALYWITSYAGVLIFVGLTAWDTQKLRMIAIATENDPAMAARLSVTGALALYLDFINLFLFLLRFMGKRR
jgi:hypothetical protein